MAEPPEVAVLAFVFCSPKQLLARKAEKLVKELVSLYAIWCSLPEDLDYRPG
jgi:hypothetical protein